MLKKLLGIAVVCVAVTLALFAAERNEVLYHRVHQLFSSPTKKKDAQKRGSVTGPIFERSKFENLPQEELPGKLIGKTHLPQLLDKLLTILNLKLGASRWFVGVATNSKQKGFYLTFMPQTKDKVIIEKMDFQRLRGDGQVVLLDEKTQYRIRLVPNIFDPARGSSIHLNPEGKTQGESHELNTGELLDLIKANSFVFQTQEEEFWLLYSTDIDEEHKQFAKTRTLGFFNEKGMDSKMWTLPESALASNQLIRVELGNIPIHVFLSSENELRIFEISTKARL